MPNNYVIKFRMFDVTRYLKDDYSLTDEIGEALGFENIHRATATMVAMIKYDKLILNEVTSYEIFRV